MKKGERLRVWVGRIVSLRSLYDKGKERMVVGDIREELERRMWRVVGRESMGRMVRFVLRDEVIRKRFGRSV